MTSLQVDRLQDMWDEINALHLSYLQTEECLEKLKEQDRLEVLIAKYLSYVPHERKFFHSEIPFILRNSVKGKKDFSASKAISAWSALANYAHNLLTQPWRKEFYEIQKFGGFFHHNIKCALLDWEVIFELIGYKVEKDVMILNEQEAINVEKLTLIARDCLIAQVECQIMLTIYAKVVKTYSECTWENILYFRESHICSAEQAIHGLLNMFLQRPEDYRDVYPNNCGIYSYPVYPQYEASHHMRHSNKLPNHAPQLVMCSHNVKEPPEKSNYHLPGYEYPTYSKPAMMAPSMHNVGPESDYIASNYPSNVYRPYTMKPQYMYRGPPYNDPEQYSNNRDVCTSCYGNNYTDYFCSYPYNNRPKFVNDMYNYPAPGPRPPENYYASRSAYPNAGSLNRPNYRRSSAYSSSNSHDVPVTKSDLENAMKAFSLDEIDKTNTDSERSDSSGLVDDLRLDLPALSKARVTSSNGLEFPPAKEFIDKKVTREIKESNERKSSRDISDRKTYVWECSYCTYHNSSKNLICEMCNKSKNVGNENQPLISGGRECHVCTLVNERNAPKCSACGENLKDSPTYI